MEPTSPIRDILEAPEGKIKILELFLGNILGNGIPIFCIGFL